jgi:hypothetical protein
VCLWPHKPFWMNPWLLGACQYPYRTQYSVLPSDAEHNGYVLPAYCRIGQTSYRGLLQCNALQRARPGLPIIRGCTQEPNGYNPRFHTMVVEVANREDKSCVWSTLQLLEAMGATEFLSCFLRQDIFCDAEQKVLSHSRIVTKKFPQSCHQGWYLVN